MLELHLATQLSQFCKNIRKFNYDYVHWRQSYEQKYKSLIKRVKERKSKSIDQKEIS